MNSSGVFKTCGHLTGSSVLWTSAGWLPVTISAEVLNCSTHPLCISMAAGRTKRIGPLQKKPPEDVQTLTMNLNHATCILHPGWRWLITSKKQFSNRTV